MVSIGAAGMGWDDGFKDLNAAVGRFDAVRMFRMGRDGIRHVQANAAYKAARQSHGGQVAEAVRAAVLAGRDPQTILDQASCNAREQREREELLRNPPPLHGSARWAKPGELGAQLRGREAFDNPRSILLGTVVEDGRLQGFLHWDDDGHLLTLAPTRTGKAVTSLVPNLLRYGGSCVVLDPKGELYELTSAWRRTLGPVYRINPFNEGQHEDLDRFPLHGINPLRRVQRYADARALAAQIFPRDPRGQDFFIDDAVNFIAPLIWYIVQRLPPDLHTIRVLCLLLSADTETFRTTTLEDMLTCDLEEVAAAAEAVVKKFPRGAKGGDTLTTFFNTLNSKLGFWRDPELLACLDGDDVDFARLKQGSGRKDQTETVYITVPFDRMQPYAPFLRVLLMASLDAMRARVSKEGFIQVLFVLDEFLAMGGFPEFQAAIRTHAGYGVRLWFVLQDLGTLQTEYPGTSWQAFFNTSVKLIFGTDETFTGEFVSNVLQNETRAFRSTNAGTNVSTQLGGEHGSAGVNFSGGESISFMGRALLTPDEVIEELAPWQPDGTRNGIVLLRSPPRPIRVRLVPFTESQTCAERVGALTVG